MVVADLDLVNEHPQKACVNTSVKPVPGQTGNISTTLSPSSPLARAGEPTEEPIKAMLSTISGALVLGAAWEADMADFLSSLFECKGVCHEWRCQALVRSALFDSRIRELDSILLSSAAEDGSSREQREEL